MSDWGTVLKGAVIAIVATFVAYFIAAAVLHIPGVYGCGLFALITAIVITATSHKWLKWT